MVVGENDTVLPPHSSTGKGAALQVKMIQGGTGGCGGGMINAE
jgi:hypothetical protein